MSAAATMAQLISDILVHWPTSLHSRLIEELRSYHCVRISWHTMSCGRSNSNNRNIMMSTPLRCPAEIATLPYWFEKMMFPIKIPCGYIVEYFHNVKSPDTKLVWILAMPNIPVLLFFLQLRLKWSHLYTKLSKVCNKLLIRHNKKTQLRMRCVST